MLVLNSNTCERYECLCQEEPTDEEQSRFEWLASMADQEDVDTAEEDPWDDIRITAMQIAEANYEVTT